MDKGTEIVGSACHSLLTEEGFKIAAVMEDSVLYRHGDGFKVTAKRDGGFTCVHPDHPEQPFEVSGYRDLGAVLSPDFR
jgi:hypothetical protein